MIQNAPIYVAYSERHGRGVFAATDLSAGSVIEVCPVLLFPNTQLEHMRKTMLDDYYFDWGNDNEWFAIALGYGSLYNHDYHPNAEYGMDFEAHTIDFYALNDIKAGTEILINYNGAPDDQTPVWFDLPVGSPEREAIIAGTWKKKKKDKKKKKK